MNSNELDGELIEARDESEEQEKQQRYAEKGQKETLANIKKITGKKQRLDKEKYTLQRKGKLPLNMSNEAEGEQLDELAPLAGLAVKAGLAAGTAVMGKMVYDKGKKVADKIKQQNQQKSDMIKNIGNSYEPEGETIEERTRYAKETGKDPQTGKPSVKGGNKPDPAFAKVSGELRKTGGLMSSRRKPIQPQGKKKEKGKVGYKERKGETGVTPVDRIRAKLAKRRAPKPDIGSRFD
jgi:hypothetical protein